MTQLQPGGDAKYDRDNPLEADLVVLDESSMIDLILANKLVKPIPPGGHLLVGDMDQLPSVGALGRRRMAVRCGFGCHTLVKIITGRMSWRAGLAAG